MIQIKVIQYLKNDIKDPEGGEVAKALVRLGYPVKNVSIGREILVDVDVVHVDEAKRLVEEMCQRLLVNPILHDYSVSVVGLGTEVTERDLIDEIWGDDDDTL